MSCAVRSGARKSARVQRLIQVQYADQSHAREVVPLGEHLGTQQELGLTTADQCQQAVQLTLATGAIPIDPYQVEVRKDPAQLLLQALGAQAQAAQIAPLAVRTGRRRRLEPTAVVAPETLEPQVQGQACIAVGTGAHPAAVVTGQNRGIAAAIEKQQDLIPGRGLRLHLFAQLRGQAGAQ